MDISNVIFKYQGMDMDRARNFDLQFNRLPISFSSIHEEETLLVDAFVDATGNETYTINNTSDARLEIDGLANLSSEKGYSMNLKTRETYLNVKNSWGTTFRIDIS